MAAWGAWVRTGPPEDYLTDDDRGAGDDGVAPRPLSLSLGWAQRWGPPEKEPTLTRHDPRGGGNRMAVPPRAGTTPPP